MDRFKTDVKPLNKDALMMTPRDRAAQVAHLSLAPIYNLPPHEQMAGVAVLFGVLASRFNFDAAELHSFGMKMLRDPALTSSQSFHKKGNAVMDSLIDFANLQKTGELSR